MTTEDKIRDEKLKYGINREAGKISALLSGKTDKYEYLTGEEIFPDQGRIIEKTFEKQIQTIKDTPEKKKKTIEDAAET